MPGRAGWRRRGRALALCPCQGAPQRPLLAGIATTDYQTCQVSGSPADDLTPRVGPDRLLRFGTKAALDAETCACAAPGSPFPLCSGSVEDWVVVEKLQQAVRMRDPRSARMIGWPAWW